MPSLDPTWLEAQYNARARVPEHVGILARWAEASELTRSRSPAARLGLAYGGDASETLDWFPAARADAPVLVFLHGGYWCSLGKGDCSFIAPAFNAAGAAVVVPDYALCPAVTVEHICLQMVRAVEWVWRHARSLGADPQRIVLAGHSVGGHMAAMLLSCRWRQVADDLPLQPLAGALAVSGLYDLEPLRHAPFLQPKVHLTPASVARLSPAFFPRPKVPLYAVVGALESEEFLRQNQLIRDVWGPTAVPVCEAAPGCHHFDVLESLVDPAGRLHALALRLLGLR